MTPIQRLLAAGTATAALLLLAAPAAPAAAADPGAGAAQKAAAYLAANLVDGDHLTSQFGDESITADAVLALVAAGRPEDAGTIDAAAQYLEAHAAGYATTPEAAAKLALVALATERDTSSFGDVDLLAAVKEGVQPDGAFGSWPGPYASGLGLVALATAGEETPAAMVDWLVQRAEPGGGWGYEPGQPADADSTGMAILGLAAVDAPSNEVTGAIASAVEWAGAARRADGSWPGMAPVNSTAVLGSALVATGAEQPESVAWLEALQADDGGLPAAADGPADLLATAQGALLLAGASYLDLASQAAGEGPGTLVVGIVVGVLVLGGAVAGRVVRRRRA